MSPNRPYHSRVLNFLNRQSLRLGDRAKVTLRQLKTATIWGVQLMVYPLYLLLQTSTLVGKQLQQTTTNVVLPPQEPTTSSVGSQPIIVVLNSIEPWLEDTPYELLPLPETRPTIGEKLQFWRKPSPSPSQHKANTRNASYVIQGIATHLETGKLVLTTVDNQGIDLLGNRQHEQLTQRIKIVLESYEQIQQPWWWRIHWQQQQSQLTPLKWLSQFMIRVQTSPLAKRLNWFGESQFRLPSTHLEISQQPPPHFRKQGLPNAIIDKLKQWREKLLPAESSQNYDPYSLGVLIQAAIDYFFGQSKQGLPENASPIASEEPWLTKADVFNREETFPKLGAVSEGNDQFAQQIAQQLTEDRESDSPAEATEIPPEDDYLQTEAVSVGYEQHFLAKLLGWLDRALAWLEQRLLQFWQWLKHQLLSNH